MRLLRVRILNETHAGFAVLESRVQICFCGKNYFLNRFVKKPEPEDVDWGCPGQR